mgnify:FL=1
MDAAATGFFMVLVAAIVALSIREWILLLQRRKPAVLCETEPVWLPDYAVAESRSLHAVGVAGSAALAFALAKELSGEADFERARQAAHDCKHEEASGPGRASSLQSGKTDARIYVEVSEKRFRGVRRCC